MKTLFGERTFTILRKTTTPRKLVIITFLLCSSGTTGREHALCTNFWQIYNYRQLCDLEWGF